MKKSILIAILIVLSFNVHAAEWSVSYNSFNKTYDVSDGNQNPIHYKTEKGAKKAAKALNKNEKKNEKKGVWADGCPDLPGVVC